GNRHRAPTNNFATDLPQEIDLAEHGRTAAAVDDLFHRAAEVHVEEFGLALGDARGRLAHAHRIAAEDLDRQRALVDVQAAGGATVLALAARDRFRADHLGDHHVGALLE